MSVKFVLLIVLFSLVFASDLHDEKFAKQKEDCTGSVYGTTSFVVPRQCSKGVIEWMNSTGQMDVTFDTDMYEAFTVCIAWWKGAVCTRLLDQTPSREGQDIAPENPLEGTPLCLHSVTGQVKISCTYSGDPTVLEYMYHIASAE